MPGAPMRQHKIINPEVCAAALRAVVAAWDADDQAAFTLAMATARQVLGVPQPVAVTTKGRRRAS